jgi:hypothetical protein
MATFDEDNFCACTYELEQLLHSLSRTRPPFKVSPLLAHPR